MLKNIDKGQEKERMETIFDSDNLEPCECGATQFVICVHGRLQREDKIFVKCTSCGEFRLHPVS